MTARTGPAHSNEPPSANPTGTSEPKPGCRVDDSGVVVVLVAVCLVALLGLTAMVVDLGNARQAARQVQNAGDAGVLAGAQDLPISGVDPTLSALARTTAAQYAADTLRAPAIATACAAPDPSTECFTVGSASVAVVTPYEGDSQRIFARVCERNDTFFGGVLGVSSTTVCREAIARATLSTNGSPAILATHPTACGSLNTHGNADVIGDGLIQINSSCPTGLTQEGANSELISTDCVCVVGGAGMQYPGNSSPPVQGNAPVAPDPYEFVPDVPRPAQNGQRAGNTFTPGYYGSRIKLEGSGTYTFQPGIYYLDAGMRVEGSATVIADGVMLYIAAGAMDMGSGPHTVRFSSLSPADDPAGVYLGLSFFQSRSNTSDFIYGDNTSAGVRSGDVCTVTPSSGVDGGIYVPSARLTIRGNNATLCASRPVVAQTMKVEEHSTLSGTALTSGGAPTRVISLVG